MVPREGFEPTNLAVQVPKTCASTNFATSAGVISELFYYVGILF